MPDEGFEADLDENFGDAVSVLRQIKDVTNIKASNFLKRPKAKKTTNSAGEVVGEEIDSSGDSDSDSRDQEKLDDYDVEDDELDIFWPLVGIIK